MKVFITGGTGNIGQYVTLAVIESGHEAVVLSRNPEKYPSIASRTKLVKGTITDYALLAEYVKGCDAVIQIALGWGDEPVSMLVNDTTATVNLLEISEKAGVKKFIYTSSTAAMGHMRNGMDETAVNLPLDLYGSTKSATEAYVLGFTKYYGSNKKVEMKRNIIRPGYTYSNPPFPDGSTQSDARFRKIAEAVVNNKPIELTKFDGTQFLSSREIAQLYVKLLESDKNEEIYLALGNEWTSWEEIAKTAISFYPQSTSEIVFTDLGWSETPVLYNVDKIKRDFGFSFNTQNDLNEHIKWTVEQAVNR
ncbi:MAG: NAD(P)-dependent oxidoreductase [Treponema sp.]|jgi:UDP-glucose 4-epimerase|nr:NAD(P)-dependent oxidoreductase [Treponema sp.]